MHNQGDKNLIEMIATLQDKIEKLEHKVNALEENEQLSKNESIFGYQKRDMDRLNSKLTLDGIDKEWVHKLRNIRSSASKLFSNVDLKNVK